MFLTNNQKKNNGPLGLTKLNSNSIKIFPVYLTSHTNLQRLRKYIAKEPRLNKMDNAMEVKNAK